MAPLMTSLFMATVLLAGQVLAQAPTTSGDIGIEEPGGSQKPLLKLNATCDNEMKVYIDGFLQAEDGAMANWGLTSALTMSPATEVLAIECLDLGLQEGILASVDNGILTDGNWSCSKVYVEGWTKPGFQDTTGSFMAAQVIGGHGVSPWGVRPGISTAAKWIWTQESSTQAFCRKVISGPTCCPRKTVAYVTYTLVSEAETGAWGCSANCVYQIAGRPGNKYCFKPGRYPATCGGMTASPPDMECPELMAFKEACKVRDTANMDKDEALYYVLKKIIMDINETNIRIDMLEERVNITETHIKELWKETIIINNRIDQLNKTIYKLICQVNYIETTQQTLIKSTTRISEVVARIDQHGAQCGYRAMFTEAQTVVTYDSIFTNDGIGSMDAGTGKWVAGASGTYAISMSAYTHLDRRDQNMINLLKNGMDVGKWGEWMFGFVGDDMGGRSLVLKLAVGDELTLKTGAMAAAEGENTQTDVKDLDFCVFLIYADKIDGKYTKDPLDPTPNECKV